MQDRKKKSIFWKFVRKNVFTNLFQNCNFEVVWIFIFFSGPPLYFAPERAKLGSEIALFAKASKPKYSAWLEKLTHIIEI